MERGIGGGRGINPIAAGLGLYCGACPRAEKVDLSERGREDTQNRKPYGIKGSKEAPKLGYSGPTDYFAL